MPAGFAAQLKPDSFLRLRSVRTDEDGGFSLSGLTDAAYVLAVVAPPYVADAAGLPSYYRPGDRATLRLVKGGVITGSVTDWSGNPRAIISAIL
jgi:hypothetical protein